MTEDEDYVYQPIRVYRAGLIPYHIDEDTGRIKMMFMRPIPEVAKWSGDVFQMAKGKIEEGEEAEAAAVREAREELGLFIGNVEMISEVGNFLGRTTVFVAKVKSMDMFGLPTDETEETAWMTEEEFLIDGRELHHPVIQACVRHIMDIENIY